MEHDDKCVITIKNLVETTCLTKYTWSTKITYDQVSEFIVNNFRISLIEKYYGITDKPISSGNSTSSAILERIHSVLVNLAWKYNIKTPI